MDLTKTDPEYSGLCSYKRRVLHPHKVATDWQLLRNLTVRILNHKEVERLSLMCQHKENEIKKLATFLEEDRSEWENKVDDLVAENKTLKGKIDAMSEENTNLTKSFAEFEEQQGAQEEEQISELKSVIEKYRLKNQELNDSLKKCSQMDAKTE